MVLKYTIRNVNRISHGHIQPPRGSGQLHNKLILEVRKKGRERKKLEKKIRKTTRGENNETIGMSAEAVVAETFNINHNINPKRISQKRCLVLQPSITKFFQDHPEIKVYKYVGGRNKEIDFLCRNENNCEETLSVKTIKRRHGKLCPQGGQPTAASWDKQYFPSLKGGLAADHSKRFNKIKKNLPEYINQMKKKLFCCDHLLVIVDCDGICPKYTLLRSKDVLLSDEYTLSRPDYVESWNEKKKSNSEFTTTIKTSDGRSVGELQFHYKSRVVVKFRFYLSFLTDISKIFNTCS